MIDDIFVFDNVIHVYDMSDDNTKGDDESRFARDSMLGIGGALRPPGYGAELNFAQAWTIEDAYEHVFVRAPTDMAMAQVVPIFEWYKDFFAPVASQYAMAQAYPDRVLFCGGVDPAYSGLEAALEQIEYQITQLGAVSMKFYNGHERNSWRCDDEKIAYPMYEKCRELGVNTVQFHKGTPFGRQPLEPLAPFDIEGPARDFPDVNFIIHHLAYPFFDATVSIASRHPNVYLALSGSLNLAIVSPRLVQEQLGRLLMEVGVHKLMWGSEAMLAGGPAAYLRAFMDLEIPEDLRSGYGYPQITREDKERILGRNFADLMGIDIDAKRAELYGAAAS